MSAWTSIYRRVPFSLSCLLMLLSTVPVTAELQYCKDAKSEAKCEAAVMKALVAQGLLASVSTKEEAKAKVGELMSTGQKSMNDTATKGLLEKIAPEIASLPGASAGFEDFLSLLKIGVGAEGLNNKQALAFDLTDFLGLPIKSGYKVQALAQEATLFEDLANQLSAEDLKKQTNGLGDFDDLLVTFSYSPSTSHLGTNLGANQILTDELFSRLVKQNTALAEKETQAVLLAGTLAANLQNKFPAAFLAKEGEEIQGDENQVQDFDLIDNLSRRQQYRVAVENAAVAEANSLTALSKILNEASFFKLADLVANQPQLVVRAMRSVRDDLVGPEETTLKVSYEMGFVNMNSLRRALAACPDDQMTRCYTDYLTDNRAALAKDGYRLTFSLDWTKREDYNLAIDNVSVDVPGRDRWCVSTTYGRNLRVDENGKFTSRIDLTGSWQDWSDDPMYQDRALANLSFTQKVNDDFSLVLGAVWASKPEFRGQVDKEVSARFGLTYRFLDKKGREIMKAQ